MLNDIPVLVLFCRQIWFCGEVVTTALFERCLKLLPWIQFLNLYSISESHDVACEDLNLYFKENMVRNYKLWAKCGENFKKVGL